MARRSEHSQEEIKKMVLEAAETIVVEEGYTELKVRKIAMEIGYTVGSVYMVFNNMADLIMHIKGRALDDMAGQLEQVDPQQDAEQVIAQLSKAYLNFAVQHFNRWRLIFEHSLAEHEEVPGWYQAKVDNIFSIVETQFKKLSTSHDEEQSKQAARALWSGVHGICSLSLSGKKDLIGFDTVDSAVVLLVDSFIRGWKQG